MLYFLDEKPPLFDPVVDVRRISSATRGRFRVTCKNEAARNLGAKKIALGYFLLGLQGIMGSSFFWGTASEHATQRKLASALQRLHSLKWHTQLMGLNPNQEKLT